jgi:hypothetical protein
LRTFYLRLAVWFYTVKDKLNIWYIVVS